MSTPALSGYKRRCPDADDGAPAERRVQPRHQRDASDSNPIADTDADAAPPVDGAAAHGAGAGAAAADADPTRPRPSAAQLYRHALESIFVFLSLREAAAALRVSKDWAAAVKAMAGLQQSFDHSRARGWLPVVAMATSAMGRHVSVIGGECDRARLSQEALFLLARHMAHLRALHCRPSKLPADGLLLFPAALRELDLDLPFAAEGRVNMAVSAIGRLAHLESLEIGMKKIRRQVSFGPLAALPLLRSLAITEGRHETTLTDAQVDQLRALSWLQEFHFDSISASLLRRLLAQPHDLQWQQITLPSYLTDEDVALLPQLPSLTALHLDDAAVSHFDFLHRLPNLESLACSTTAAEDLDADLPNHLVAALRHCATVTHLELKRLDSLTAAHLADLLPRLPRLHSLTLHRLGIDSLSFLSQAPLTDQLRSLILERCNELPVDELRHVVSLGGLRELRIDRSFNEPMDPESEMLMALDPPSVVLPLLKSFIYVELGESAPDHESSDSEDETEGAHAAAAAAAVDDEDAGQNGPDGAAPDEADYYHGWDTIIF